MRTGSCLHWLFRNARCRTAHVPDNPSTAVLFRRCMRQQPARQ
jgi:hypothetical protein